MGIIDYIYTADGTKIAKMVSEGSSLTTTEYCGNFVYEKVGTTAAELKFFSTPEGYVEPEYVSGAIVDWDYIYQCKDHLGNIRLSYSDDNDDSIASASEIREENNYYPFGLKHKGYNGTVNGRDHKFEYNGMELEESLGINMMEMDMRQFDPAIARWVVQDPVTHHDKSTYNAFDNNPVYWADPSGADGESGITVHSSDHVEFTGAAAQEAYAEVFGGSSGGDGDADPKEGQKRIGTKHVEIGGIDSYSGPVKERQIYHAGGVFGSEARWYSEEEYFNVIKPIAESLSRWMGGRRDASGSLGSLEARGSYDTYLKFVTSRSTVEGYTSFLLAFADGITHGHNSRVAYKMSGNATAMYADSPFFLGALGIAGRVLGFSSSRTILGSDTVTGANASRMVSEKGIHQLLVHGSYDAFIINGVMTSPKDVARIMLRSGFKRGTTVRCISCHTGKFVDGAAAKLARFLKSPVLAPTDKVRIIKGGRYVIKNKGYWKEF